MSSITLDAPSIALTDAEKTILDAYHDAGTYELAARSLGCSRGKVFRVVMKAGARKHEDRIRARADARKHEQTRIELLREIVGTSTTADVLDFARSLPSNSVALHATSLPYNVSKRYGNYPSSDRDSFLAYRGNLMILTSEIARTLKPGGVAFLQIGMTKDDTGHRAPIDKWLFHMLAEAGLTFQSEVYWQSQHGLTPTMRLAERMEVALVFSKGDVLTFNPTPAREPTKQPSKRSWHGPNKGNISSHPSGSFPTNVWRIPHLGHNHPELTEHPAQFPVALAMRAILLWTIPENDLVCDLFVGSGSTHAACIRTGRPFVGCDLFYESLREKRIASVVPDLVSVFPGVTDDSLALWQAEAHRCDLPGRPIAEAARSANAFRLNELRGGIVSNRVTRLPSQNQMALPVMTAIAAAGGVAKPGALYDDIAARLNLDDVTRNATVHAGVAGNVNEFERAVRWTRQSLVMKGLISRETRGRWELTDAANVKLKNIIHGAMLHAFSTDRGVYIVAHSSDAVALIERESIQLLITSPPYPLNRGKSYQQGEDRSTTTWVDNMLRLCEAWRELLTPTGSLMLNLGPVWKPGMPAQSLYIERLLIRLSDTLGYHLLQRIDAHAPNRLGCLPWVGI